MLSMPQQTFIDVVIAEIKAEMARQDVTQTELARRLGCAQSQINRRLHRRVRISAEDIEQIAAALGTTVHALGWPFAEEPKPAPRRRRMALTPSADGTGSLYELEETGDDDGQ
jgi:transcriptional regulator with XRE-family HTH domain